MLKQRLTNYLEGSPTFDKQEVSAIMFEATDEETVNFVKQFKLKEFNGHSRIDFMGVTFIFDGYAYLSCDKW